MKKVFKSVLMAVACVLTLQFMVSCDGNSTSRIDDFLRLQDEYIEGLNNAKTAEEITSLSLEMQQRMIAWQKEHKDYKLTDAENKRIHEKNMEIKQVASKRILEVAQSGIEQSVQNAIDRADEKVEEVMSKYRESLAE